MHIVIFTLLACSTEQPPQHTAPPSDASAFTSLMHLHYELATSIRNAVIEGDLDKVHANASKLEALESPAVPAAWNTHVVQMKAEAAALAKVGDVDAAAVGVARLAQSCAACHEASGGGPRAQAKKALTDEVPKVKPGQHMRLRHLWVADRMWLGLVTPNDRLVRGAAGLLASSELHEKAQHAHDKGKGKEKGKKGKAKEKGKKGKGKSDVPAEFVLLEEQIHSLAEAATRPASTPEEQAKVYGHFLANCARCHKTMGIHPALGVKDAQPPK